MRRCIELARRARASGDSPVGAVVVRNGQIAGEGIERVKATGDVTAHAEIEAVRAACKQLGRLDLTGCTLFTTVAPCVMCAYAIRLARVSSVISGTRSSEAARAVTGAMVLTNQDILPDRPVPIVIEGVLDRECRTLLTGSER
jgi:tRNA(adenine34) deaminase